jgi:hypothetical protein
MESFKNGGRDLIVDLRPWMGAGPGSLPWLHNNNLAALVDELSTLLTGGQLPPAARTIVRNHITTLPYNSKAITAVSAAPSTPCFLTLNAHGLTVGQTVTIAGITGGNFSASINGTFTVTAVTTNTFAVGVNRLSGGTTVSVTGATVTPAVGFPDLLRDRIRATVHLIVTSPDYTIQK